MADFISNHQRTAIRRYLKLLVTNEVSIDRVFLNRPNPIFLSECPCCLIYFEIEQAQIIVGDQYNPKEYERGLRVNIDFLAEERITADEIELDTNEESEDLLDFYSWQTEQAIAKDNVLKDLLPADHVLKQDGLSFGLSVLQCAPYNIDVDTQYRIVAQRNTINCPYETHAYASYRFKDFLEYKADFLRFGVNDQTVDPILLGAEGEVNES